MATNTIQPCRVLKTTPEKLYRAFLDGDAMAKWLPPYGFTVRPGNNIYINLEPDTRSETRRLFKALAEGGKVEMQLQEMFWGGYFGNLIDKHGVNWMFNCESKD